MNYYPYHYKTTDGLPSGKPYFDKNETVYRDDSAAFVGNLISYLRALSQVPDGPMPKDGEHQLTWTSAAARDKHGSAWTATIAEVGWGQADLGLSIFWVTRDRLRMATFTAPLYTDHMRLYVPHPPAKTDTLIDKIKLPFEPFDPMVWGTVIAIVFVHALLKVSLTARLWWAEWADKVGWERARFWRKALFLLGRFFESSYESTLITYGGAPDFDEQHRLATRFLNIGFGIFLLIVLNSYTANLTTFLTWKTPPFQPYVKNMFEASISSPPTKVCAHKILQPTFDNLWPRANFHYRYMDTGDDVRAAILEDGCDAFVVSERAMSVQDKMEKARCELVASSWREGDPKGFIEGELVASVEVALPARPDVANAMSYWMKHLEEEARITYGKVLANSRTDRICSLSLDASINFGLHQLTVEEFIGPLLIFGAFVGLAILTRSGRICFKNRDTVVTNLRKGALGSMRTAALITAWKLRSAVAEQRAIEVGESSVRQQSEILSAVKGIYDELNSQQQMILEIAQRTSGLAVPAKPAFEGRPSRASAGSARTTAGGSEPELNADTVERSKEVLERFGTVGGSAASGADVARARLSHLGIRASAP